MRVISTERSQVLAARVSEKLGVPLAKTRFSRFPDGEIYLRCEDLDDETLIVSSITDNDMLVQTLLAIDAADGSRNTLVIPYLGYARQDRRFGPGEPISARAVARALSSGIERVIVVDVHDPAVLDYFGVPATGITIAPAIGGYIGDLHLREPLVLAPDEGAIGFASTAAAGGWDCDFPQKTRLSGEVRIAPKAVDVAGRVVVIVDDIISTGAPRDSRQHASRTGSSVHPAACVHGVLASGATCA